MPSGSWFERLISWNSLEIFPRFRINSISIRSAHVSKQNKKWIPTQHRAWHSYSTKTTIFNQPRAYRDRLLPRLSTNHHPQPADHRRARPPSVAADRRGDWLVTIAGMLEKSKFVLNCVHGISWNLTRSLSLRFSFVCVEFLFAGHLHLHARVADFYLNQLPAISSSRRQFRNVVACCSQQYPGEDQNWNSIASSASFDQIKALVSPGNLRAASGIRFWFAATAFAICISAAS